MTTIPQSVEGENPVNDRAKVALEVTRGGLTPSWGGVRRSRQTKIVADRQVTGFQHILLRLNQAREMQKQNAEKERKRNTEEREQTNRERYKEMETDTQKESAFPLISNVCCS